MTKFYTVQQLADMLGIHKQTVYDWIYAGDLHTVQIKRKSAHRIPESEVRRLTTFDPMEMQPTPEA
jgi:excisionase family DNA binding protein